MFVSAIPPYEIINVRSEKTDFGQQVKSEHRTAITNNVTATFSL